MLVERDLAGRLRDAASKWPAVTLTGPRQSGKTTLCRSVFADYAYVSLESPDTRQFATEDPRGFLASLTGGAIIDEIQREPDLVSYLQGIIDDSPQPGRWILTGSHNLALAASVSQSLTGRTAMLQLLPLTRNEIARFGNPAMSLDEALHAGGYPAIFERGIEPADWHAAYVATYLERDVRTITNVGDLDALTRFVRLCAGLCGRLVNYSSLAADCGISQPTAKAWLSILEATYVAFRLPAFHANLRKRFVKMPKLHFFDTGLACWLLGIRDPSQLASHPLRGALFETWTASEIAKHRANRGLSGGLMHYRERGGREVDIVIEDTGTLTLVEAKATATPSGRLIAPAAALTEQLSSLSTEVRAAAVYGGNSRQRRGAGEIIPWLELEASPLAQGPSAAAAPEAP